MDQDLYLGLSDIMKNAPESYDEMSKMFEITPTAPTIEDVKRAEDGDITIFAESKVKLVERLKENSNDPDCYIKMKYEDMDIHWDCPEVYEHWTGIKDVMKITKTNNAGIVLDKRGLLPPFFIVWADPSELVDALTKLINTIKDPLYSQFIHTNYYLLQDQLDKTLGEVLNIVFPNLVEELCKPLRRNYFVEEEMNKIFSRLPIKNDDSGLNLPDSPHYIHHT